MIKFEKVDKPKGEGGLDNVDKVIWLNFGTFWCVFFGYFNTYLVVFSLYLAIIKNTKKNYK